MLNDLKTKVFETLLDLLSNTHLPYPRTNLLIREAWSTVEGRRVMEDMWNEVEWWSSVPKASGASSLSMINSGKCLFSPDVVDSLIRYLSYANLSGAPRHQGLRLSYDRQVGTNLRSHTLLLCLLLDCCDWPAPSSIMTTRGICQDLKIFYSFVWSMSNLMPSMELQKICRRSLCCWIVDTDIGMKNIYNVKNVRDILSIIDRDAPFVDQRAVLEGMILMCSIRNQTDIKEMLVRFGKINGIFA